MKRMLINATQPEELRVAIVDGQKLFNLDIEVPGRELKKANIYKGRITRVEPSLEAAFVDYGAERHGFLPMKEIARSYFSESAQSSGKRPTIREAIKEGQEVVVQVEKEERGNKGAALTTFLSLAGRYLVLMPNNPRAGGVSRRIEGQDRSELREAMSALEIPDGMGLIVRTAGIGKNIEELQWDLDYLLQLWSAIEQSADSREAPFLIYQESNVIIRSIRDHLRADIGEIVIDDENTFSQARQFIRQVMPNNERKLRLYEDRVPLFSRYQIESQIESAFQREVRLPSGGSIVIDHTEALTSIDINSARATKGSDIEETALNTNREAAVEIARQLRLRDLGGLFVIDFIDMTPSRNQREVENRLKEAMKEDRARVQIGRISRFGLLEMSRQRIRPSLGDSSNQVCPRCEGHGFIRSVDSLALSILRIIEEETLKESTARVMAQLPVEVATYLLNEKRQIIADIEQRHNLEIILIPNKYMETPKYEIERVRRQDEDTTEDLLSYESVTREPEAAAPLAATASTPSAEEPAVKQITPAAPAPVRQVAAPAEPAKENTESSGLIKRLFTSIFNPRTEQPAAGTQEESTQEKSAEQKAAEEKRRSDRSDRRGSSERRRSSSRGGRSSSQSKGRRSDQTRRKSSSQNGDKKQEGDKKKEANKNEGKPAEKQRNEQKADGEQPKRSSRRGRRGGRRRRGGGNASGEAAENNANKNNSSNSAAAEGENRPKGGSDIGGSESRQQKPRRRRNESSGENKETRQNSENKTPGKAAREKSESAPAQASEKPAAVAKADNETKADTSGNASAEKDKAPTKPAKADAEKKDIPTANDSNKASESVKPAAPAPKAEKTAPVIERAAPAPATKAVERAPAPQKPPASVDSAPASKPESKPTAPAPKVAEPAQAKQEPPVPAPAAKPKPKPKPEEKQEPPAGNES